MHAGHEPEVAQARQQGLIRAASGIEIHGEEPDLKDAMVHRALRLPVVGTSALNVYTSRSGIAHHLRTIFRDGWICTAYEPSNVYDGTEGELYRVDDDPHQRVNLWDDAGYRGVRDDLVADLFDTLPEPRAETLGVVARV